MKKTAEKRKENQNKISNEKERILVWGKEGGEGGKDNREENHRK